MYCFCLLMNQIYISIKYSSHNGCATVSYCSLFCYNEMCANVRQMCVQFQLFLSHTETLAFAIFGCITLFSMIVVCVRIHCYAIDPRAQCAAGKHATDYTPIHVHICNAQPSVCVDIRVCFFVLRCWSMGTVTWALCADNQTDLYSRPQALAHLHGISINPNFHYGDVKWLKCILLFGTLCAPLCMRLLIRCYIFFSFFEAQNSIICVVAMMVVCLEKRSSIG